MQDNASSIVVAGPIVGMSELNYTSANTPAINLLVSRKYVNTTPPNHLESDAEIWDVAVFGEQARHIFKGAKVSDRILVVGYLQHRKDSDDNLKPYLKATEVGASYRWAAPCTTEG